MIPATAVTAFCGRAATVITPPWLLHESPNLASQFVQWNLLDKYPLNLLLGSARNRRQQDAERTVRISFPSPKRELISTRYRARLRTCYPLKRVRLLDHSA